MSLSITAALKDLLFSRDHWIVRSDYNNRPRWTLHFQSDDVIVLKGWRDRKFSVRLDIMRPDSSDDSMYSMLDSGDDAEERGLIKTVDDRDRNVAAKEKEDLCLEGAFGFGIFFQRIAIKIEHAWTANDRLRLKIIVGNVPQRFHTTFCHTLLIQEARVHYRSQVPSVGDILVHNREQYYFVGWLRGGLQQIAACRIKDGSDHALPISQCTQIVASGTKTAS